MKYKLFVVLFCTLTINYICAFSLKEQVSIDRAEVFLQDMIIEDISSALSKIVIRSIEPGQQVKISSSEVAETLYNHTKTPFTLSGNFSLVYRTSDDIKFENKNQKAVLGETPLDILRRHLYSILDKDLYTLIITVDETIPSFNLDKEYSDCAWVIPKMQKGIVDIPRFKKLVCRIDGKSITVKLDIKLMANIYITKENLRKDELIYNTDVYVAKVDVTKIDDFTTLLNEPIFPAQLSKNLKSGEFVRFDHITLPSLIKKGETVAVLLQRSGIEIELSGKALESGNEGKSISVTIDNGNKLHGVIRSTERGKIIEIK